MDYNTIYRPWYDEIHLRKMKYEDLPAVMEYYRRAVRFMNDRGIRMWDDLYPTETDLTADLKRNDIWIAVHNGKPIATAVLNCNRDEQYDEVKWDYPEECYMVIHRMCIDPDYTGQGLGSYMLYNCERMIAEKGYNHIRLDTFHGNYPALKLYDTFGYKINGGAYYRKGFILMLEKTIAPDSSRWSQ